MSGVRRARVGRANAPLPLSSHPRESLPASRSRARAMARRFLEARAYPHPARVRTTLPRWAVAVLALEEQSPALRGAPSRAAMRSSTFALEPGFGENVGVLGPQVDGFDQDDRRVGRLHLVVDPDLRRVPEIALLGLAVLLLPSRIIEGAHQSTRQREFLPLEYVGGRGVDPQLDDRKRDVDPWLHFEVQSMDVVGAELVVALVAGVVLLGQARLVKVRSSRIGSSDSFSLGPTFPFADIRIIGPEILVHPQITFALLALRFAEEDDQPLVGAATIDDCLTDHVGLVPFLLLEIDQSSVVPVVLLPIVQHLEQLNNGDYRALEIGRAHV